MGNSQFVDTNFDPLLQALFGERAAHSEGKLDSLKAALSKQKDITSFENVAIFTAGSYARREASKYSDIDLFFISNKEKSFYQDEYNVPIIRLMSSVVKIGDDLGFPKFSNDGQFLKLIHLTDILEHLGGSYDDYHNFFTTRLLLILESEPLYNLTVYENAMTEIISAYFRDYPGHTDDFRPNFLINDIVRFWKTLCLNYENKRNQPADNVDRKLKQKIKNFKLKFSRMMTCYASISYLCAIDTPISEDQVHEMVKLTPSNRFRMLPELCDVPQSVINSTLAKYHWFLGVTNVSEESLFEFFSEDNNRIEAFKKANEFSDTLFEIMSIIDKKRDIFRYLVV